MMEPREILMDFQAKLKLPHANKNKTISPPQLMGPLQKYVCKQPASSPSFVSFCRNCSCASCQSQMLTNNVDDPFTNIIKSITEQHEHYLKNMRQEFQKTLAGALHAWRDQSVTLSDTQIHNQTSQTECNDAKRFSEDRSKQCNFLSQVGLGSKSIELPIESYATSDGSKVGGVSQIKDPCENPKGLEMKPSSSEDQKDDENYSSLALKSVQSDASSLEAVSACERKDSSQWITFASGNECRPLRRSSNLRSRESSFELLLTDCQVNLVDISESRQFKNNNCQETAVNSSTSLTATKSLPSDEQASFLQDLSLVRAKPASKKVQMKSASCTEVYQTKSGRIVQKPGQFWTQSISGMTKRKTIKAPTVVKKASLAAEIDPFSTIKTTCTGLKTSQVLPSQNLAAKRRKGVSKISLQQNKTNVLMKLTDIDDINEKQRMVDLKKTVASKDKEIVAKSSKRKPSKIDNLSVIVNTPPVKRKAKCGSTQKGSNHTVASKPGTPSKSNISIAHQSQKLHIKKVGGTQKSSKRAHSSNDEEGKLLQQPQKRLRSKKNQPRREDLSMAEPEPKYYTYFRKSID